MAFAGGVTGLLLSLANYVPNVPQSELTLTVINLMFSVGPIIFLLIGLLIVKKYELTEDAYSQIMDELD